MTFLDTDLVSSEERLTLLGDALACDVDFGASALRVVGDDGACFLALALALAPEEGAALAEGVVGRPFR
jgi:hypothetical protein